TAPLLTDPPPTAPYTLSLHDALPISRPATLVHARTYQRLCETCALGLDVLTVAELARVLGIACRLAPVMARSGRHAAAEEPAPRSEEHTSELQSLAYLVCRLLLEKKK